VRLIVKKDGQVVDELKFSGGPIHIGRRSSSDIALPDPRASKQHALITNAKDGAWTIEDLDSANKTYLNDSVVKKAELKNGDRLAITGFTIEVELEADSAADEPDFGESASEMDELEDLLIDQSGGGKLEIGESEASGLDEEIDIDISDIEVNDISTTESETAVPEKTGVADKETIDTAAAAKESAETAAATGPVAETTAGEQIKSDTDQEPQQDPGLMVASHEPQIIIRKVGAEKAPPIRFDSARMVEFLQAVEAVSKAESADEVLLVLLEAVSKQFGSCYTWAALRNRPEGPMTSHAGRRRDGSDLDFKNIPLNDKINEAIEESEFLLLIFSRDMDLEKGKQVRSALVAPVINSSGCYGAIYTNNTFRDEHYDLGDLDYLMFICIHAATVLQKM